MKTKDLLSITTAALGAAVLTVLAFGSRPLEAGPGEIPPPQIAQPKLQAHGLTLSLAAAKATGLKAGDQPAFDLTVVNTNDADASAVVRVAMSCSAPLSPMARTIPIPALVWQERRALTLKPHETNVFAFPTHTTLPADKVVMIGLEEATESSTSAVASKAGPPSAPGLLSPRGIVALTFTTATHTPPVASVMPAGFVGPSSAGPAAN